MALPIITTTALDKEKKCNDDCHCVELAPAAFSYHTDDDDESKTPSDDDVRLDMPTLADKDGQGQPEVR